MKLDELVSALDQKDVWGRTDIDIREIVFDSRQAKPAAVFVAITGTQQDGHLFAADAAARGVEAVIVERKLPLPSSITQVVVPESRKALALISATFYGFPGKKLRVIGVTGTDGKTTTSTLIGSILETAGHKTGLITTINAKIGDRLIDTGFHTTTPDAPDLQKYLSDMIANGAEYAVLETTSHGLAQDRMLGAEYDVATITNVTHEHLDYHGTYENYLAAKGKLIEQLASSYRKPGVPKVSITNADDTSCSCLRRFSAEVKLSYGIRCQADVAAKQISLGGEGSQFIATTPQGEFEVCSSLRGMFNIYNILAAITVGISQGLTAADIQRGIEAVKGIPGRVEAVDCGQDFSVIIDFAHTPASLEQMLQLARILTHKRVIVVFGCPGLRDREKRPMMGEIAGRLADMTIITADDPRTESLDAILSQIAAGLEKAQRREGIDYFKIGDRTLAIEFAIKRAQPGDLVIVAGKGHEKSMCFGKTEFPWSEHAAVRKALGHT